MKIKVPTKPSDITLHQVQSLLLIGENKDISQFPKMVHSVALVTNKTPEEVGQIHYVDLENIYINIMNMINGAGEAPLVRKVKYLGREYAFIEDVRDMETGAFVDIDEMAKEENYAANLHKLMAIMYRPVEAEMGKHYKLKSYVKESEHERKERQAIFLKHMTLDVVRGATGFFLLVTQRCLGISKNLSPLLPKEIIQRVVTHGVGITSFTL